MTSPYPRIRINREDGGLALREGVCIAFYMRRSHAEVVSGVRRALATYRDAVGANTLGWYVDDEGEWRELDAQGWATQERQLGSPLGTSLLLRGSSEGVSPYQVEYRGWTLDALPFPDRGAACAVSFWLPTEYLETHGPARVRDLATQLAEPLPFNSGHAGLCFQGQMEVVGVGAAVRDACFRHPGMDIPNLSRSSRAIGARVRGAHWLNFLGQPVLGELGGVQGLRARLPPSVFLLELGAERIAAMLGEAPEAGDTEAGRTLPLYRQWAQVLEPWHFEEPGRWSGFSDDDMRRWRRRFLD